MLTRKNSLPWPALLAMALRPGAPHAGGAPLSDPEAVDLTHEQALEAALSRPAPVCWIVARQLQLDDRVRHSACIHAGGTVAGAIVILGHSILGNCAEEGVMKWRCRPILDGGKPSGAIAELSFTIDCSTRTARH
jgi:hypothetical protein